MSRSRPACRLVAFLVIAAALVLPAGGTHFAGGEVPRLRISDIEVSLSEIDYGDGVARSAIELTGVWDDTDIVHVVGEARFRFRVTGRRAAIGDIRFRGLAMITDKTHTVTVPMRGRLSGVYLDDIIIGTIGSGDPLDFDATRGLLLPAVQ